jgi:hypothetical protein
MVMIQPIFDPVLPVEVRAALLEHRKWMRPASGSPPGPWLWCGGAAKEVVRALGVGAVCALVPGVLVFTGVLGRVGKTVAVTAQAAIAALWFADADAGIVTTLIVQALCTFGALASMKTWRVRRRVLRAHGHYLLNEDFDAESQAILTRAQGAIGAVTGSSVAMAGLLDDMAGHLVLSRQEWEIAQMLRRRPGRRGGNFNSVIRRVEALERYAECVRAADMAYPEVLAAPEPAGTNDRRLDLAESVALAEIDDLIEDARRVEETLRSDTGRR